MEPRDPATIEKDNMVFTQLHGPNIHKAVPGSLLLSRVTISTERFVVNEQGESVFSHVLSNKIPANTVFTLISLKEDDSYFYGYEFTVLFDGKICMFTLRGFGKGFIPVFLLLTDITNDEQ